MRYRTTPELKALRAAARTRDLVPGATVVAVAWNSLEAVCVLVEMVRRYSPITTKIIIVDNASTDSTVRWLADHAPEVLTIERESNDGHGLAMDVGWLHSSTTHTVALDVDDFPIREDWLSTVLDPLDAGSALAGGQAGTANDYIHASFLAMRTERFVQKRHTFQGSLAWDTAELLSIRERRTHVIPVSERRGPGPVGTIYGNVVYHNFYTTRFYEGATTLDEGIHALDAQTAWAEALDRFVER